MRQVLCSRWPELAATLLGFVIFAAFSGPMLLRQSQAPHFVHQAAGFLEGSLSIPGQPPNLNDWVRIDDRWFVSFPPFPAVLMLPFVALHGLAFNDVFFSVGLAAVALGLFVAMLRAFRSVGEHERSDREMLALAAFLGFGTVFFPAAIRGEVWFTAHVVGLGLTAIYLLASVRARWPVLAGIAFACAALTRANLIFAFPFFLLQSLVASDVKAKWATVVSRWVRFGMPAAVILLVAFWMNHERFGDWSEFGHRLLYRNRVNSRITEFGLFHPHFFVENVRSAFLLLPGISIDPLRVSFDGNGMSMLVTTPLLMLVPFVRHWTWTTFSVALTALFVALPGFFYMNNGWFQFGYRFSIDYLPYLFLLLALGARPMKRTFFAFGLAGVAVCTWGAVAFNR